MVEGVVAIIKAGGAYVPIDPAYPDARIRHIVEESGTPLVLTHAHLVSRAGRFGVPALCLDRDEVRPELHALAASIAGPGQLA